MNPAVPLQAESDPTRAAAASELQRALAPVWPGLRCLWARSLTSTNSVLVDEVRLGAMAPTLLVADEQTAGKGRLGRPWQSRPGMSLTFSLALPLVGRDWSGLSLAIGVALAESLSAAMVGSPGDESGLSVRLKWPNDLWLLDGNGVGRKLAGILIEGVHSRSHGRVAVIGTGINLLPRHADDGVLTTGYASVSEFWPHPAPLPLDVLRCVAPALLVAVQQFGQEGFAAFAERFEAFDLLKGRTVHTRATMATAPLDAPINVGVAAGIDAQGALLIRTAHGTTAVSSGEISVRLGDGHESPVPDFASRQGN